LAKVSRSLSGNATETIKMSGQKSERIYFEGVCDVCSAAISTDWSLVDGMIDYKIAADGRVITWIRHYATAPAGANPDCAIYSSEVWEVRREQTETRATTPNPVDLDPLEFWCDLAEVLGHPRPARVNPASVVAEVNDRLAPDSIRGKAEQVAEQIVPNCLARTCFVRECEWPECSGCDEARTERRRLADIIVAELTEEG
jgi:hypothetical protein